VPGHKVLAADIRTEFLESLRTPHYQQDWLQIKDASTTTCEWIWDRPEYLSYRESTKSSILHVRGKAGSGKSVLAKHVWKRLSQKLADSPRNDSCALLYYCCDKRTRPDETASSILRALIHQFISQRPSLFGVVVARSELMQSYPFLQGVMTWTFDALWSIFKAVVINSQLQTIHCVIDGLDESEKESTEVFLPLLTEFLDQDTNGVTVKLFLTSRIEGHIEDYLEGHATSILVDSAVTRRDVETYISERLAMLKKRLKLDREGEQNLRQVLVDGAEGMFLWAELAIKDLEKTYGLTAKTLTNRVRLFPSGLNALYDRMLKKIDGKCEDADTVRLIRKIFTWIVLATRPLTLAELRIVLALQGDTEYLASLDPLQNITYDLLHLCGSFIEIVRTDDTKTTKTQDESSTFEDRSKNWENEDYTATVHLIHQSAKEYLIGSWCDLDGSLSKFQVSSRAGHNEIARTCITYLLCRDFENGPVRGDNHEPNTDPTSTLAGLIGQKLANHGFLEYATLYWPTHVRESSKTGEGEHVLDRACEFLSQFPMQFESWYQVSFFLRSTRVDYTSGVTGVHAAAFLGLCDVLRLLLDRGAEIETKATDNSTALHDAAQNGCLEVVRLLLNRGAEIEAKTTDNCTALHYAAQKGHLEVVELLLNRGAEIEAKTTDNSTALHYTAQNGHLEIVELLLDREAEIKAKTTNNWTALHYAALYGNLEIIRLLLNRGAEIEVKDTDNWTALHFATQNEHLEVIGLLLDQGAVIEAKATGNWTALHHAAVYGSLEVVKLLLKQRAEIEAKDTYNWTALHCAARNGHLEIVKLLLDQGADIETKTIANWTTLHCAASGGHLEVAKLLLKQRAEIGVKDTDNWTALHYAAQNGHLEMAKLLLDQGAEIETKTITNWTTLHCAASGGHLEVAKLLLKQRAEIGVKDTDNWTALHYAAGNGHLEMTKLLLDQGAEVEAKTTDNCTALHCAASNGDLEVVKLLLKRGAGIGTKSTYNWTALHYAAQNGYLEMIKLLLDQGAEIEAKTISNWTAFHFAAEYGSLEVIRLLLDQGAEIEARTTDDCSTLLLAAQQGHLEVVKLLLEAGITVNTQEYGNAMQVAAYIGKEALVHLLVERGTGISAQSDKFGDALQLGCIKGHIAVVDNLIQAGADPNKVDEHGWTPILCASQCQQKTVLERLIAAGGDLRLAAQTTTPPPTSWSEIDKSTHLLLDENAMSVRYIGKASQHPSESCEPNQLYCSSRYGKHWSNMACRGSSEPPNSSPKRRFLL
jgi:ankyrin repeat protein